MKKLIIVAIAVLLTGFCFVVLSILLLTMILPSNSYAIEQRQQCVYDGICENLITLDDCPKCGIFGSCPAVQTCKPVDCNPVECTPAPQEPWTRFKPSGEGSLFDNGSGLVWQSGGGDLVTWYEAAEYCRNLELDGRSWEVPTLKQLNFIVDEDYKAIGGASIDPAFESRRGVGYWTSDTWLPDPIKAWSVNFVKGYNSTSRKDSRMFVRCVEVRP